MPTCRRGTPLPINQAMNRSRSKLGIGLSTWLVLVFASALVFLVGLRMVALLLFPLLAGGAWLATRRHPKIFDLWGLSLKQKAYYDPRQR